MGKKKKQQQQQTKSSFGAFFPALPSLLFRKLYYNPQTSIFIAKFFWSQVLTNKHCNKHAL